MSSALPRGSIRVLVPIAALALGASAIGAQEPDSLRAETPRSGGCVLTWEPLRPNTTSLSLRDSPESHVSYVSGRMLWTCGTATMEADSAVNYESRGQVDLIGNVVYRDTIRTLESGLLTYFENRDLVVAREDVELVRIQDGSTLTGPRVEFLRAVSGVDELTTATGRPHMTLYPEADEPGPPFEIDADRTVFAGEEEARAYGDVVIRREDLDAEADSAHLRRDEGIGILWGDPWIDAQGVRLEGDTIRFYSEEEQLRNVYAIGRGHAIGESFEVRAERIDAAVVNEEVDRVWAYGEGGSEAVSGDHLLWGDSLEFAMHAGQIDSVFSIEQAMAIQSRGPISDARLSPREIEDPVVADSAAAEDSIAVPADSIAPPADSVAPPPADSAVAAQDPESRLDAAVARVDTVEAPGLADVPAGADSLAAPLDSLAAAPDSLAAAPDSLAAAPDSLAAAPDSLAAALDSLAAAPDSLAAAPDSLAAAPDSLDPDPGSAELPAADTAGTRDSTGVATSPGEEVPLEGAPRLDVNGRSNWVRGDTLIAIFERRLPSADSADTVLPGDSAALMSDSALIAPPDSARIPAADSVLQAAAPAPDSIGAATAAADSASDPRMKELIVIGNARSFFRQVRDSARTDRPSRNYMVGRRIEVRFEAGEPKTVFGVNAIGLYLEPEEALADSAGAAPGPEIEAVPSDSAAASMSADSLSVPSDSLPLPADSLPIPPDSSSAPPDTSRIASPTGSSRADTSPARDGTVRTEPLEAAWRGRER